MQDSSSGYMAGQLLIAMPLTVIDRQRLHFVTGIAKVVKQRRRIQPSGIDRNGSFGHIFVSDTVPMSHVKNLPTAVF